jgi:hypothetical protein
MRWRPSILGLMGCVAVIAIAMAALRSNDAAWSAVVLALTILALSTSTVVAVYRRGEWAGFAVFGWAMFSICQPHSAPPLGPTTLPMQMAYRVVFYVSDPVKFPWVSFQIPGYPSVMTDGDGNPFLGVIRGTSSGFRGMVPLNSLRAGLCLLCVAFGSVGAIVGGFVRRSAEREQADGLG